MAYNSREDLVRKLEQRAKYLSENEPPTPITIESVQADLDYFDSLESVTDDDVACNWYDRNLMAMLKEGYKLSWSNDQLWINGKPRKLPLELI